jgi:hypothetical protein
MLLMHWTRRAASRAAWTAGSNSAIRTLMIAMTTSSSINVKALDRANIAPSTSLSCLRANAVIDRQHGVHMHSQYATLSDRLYDFHE